MKNYIDVEEKLPILKTLPLSFQHLFAMVGATILVPMLTGLSPSIALFCSGVGTLLYILCTKAKLPAYIGSSFAFIAAMKATTAAYGQGATQGGIIAAGVIYAIVALIINFTGSGWLNKILPPVVVGAVVIVIGLSVAGVAINWAGLGAQSPVQDASKGMCVLVAAITLIVGVFGTMHFKGFLGVIPILIAMVVGYISAICLGVIKPEELREIVNTPFFRMPKFMAPKFNLNAILVMAPVSFVTIAEHIGHVYVTNSVVGRDFTKEPGLHRSILGDGVATIFAGLVGGPPNTTYGENIGVMAITKVYSVWVIFWAAVIAVVLSFIGPVTAVIEHMPPPVMGGVSILLFGIIASSGFRVFVEDKIDFSKKRNLIIASIIIVIGVGGATLQIPGTSAEISSVALATISGIILNLLLPEVSKSEESVDDDSEKEVAAAK